MFLTPEDFQWLVWNGLWLSSLGICLALLLIPAIRQRRSVLGWVVFGNLIAGGLFYATYPVAWAQQALFSRADPGYADLPFTGRSLHIPQSDLIPVAAYSCFGASSASSCEFPYADRIQDGTLDFVDLGTDPILRYELVAHDPTCFEEDVNGSLPQMLSAGLGVCVLGRPVAQSDADHVLTLAHRQLSWPSAQGYYHATLTDQRSQAVVGEFDSWFWRPHPAQEDTTPPRAPQGAIAALLTPLPVVNQYQRDVHDAYLEQYGLDEAILRLAAASPYQGRRAEAIWLGCNQNLTLSPDTVAALIEASVDLFSDRPAWRYPDDCPAFAK